MNSVFVQDNCTFETFHQYDHNTRLGVFKGPELFLNHSEVYSVQCHCEQEEECRAEEKLETIQVTQ
jgi:hypothetical protein